ncbi:hypothetical protein [Streptomyces galilaeus]
MADVLRLLSEGFRSLDTDHGMSPPDVVDGHTALGMDEQILNWIVTITE